jgi:hypothetical protein
VIGRVLFYLALCGTAGILLGRAFGEFARAAFHYPFNYTTVSPRHRAVLAALDVVEWPSLFVLALITALALWRSVRPRARPSISEEGGGWWTITFLVALAIAEIATLPAARPEGRWIVVGWGVAAAAAVTWLIQQLWREATAARPTVWRRTAGQLPVAAGHLTVSAIASGFLGFRGESALVHGIMLMVAAAVFAVEIVWILLTAAIAQRLDVYR